MLRCHKNNGVRNAKTLITRPIMAVTSNFSFDHFSVFYVCLIWSFIILFRPPEHKKHNLYQKCGDLISPPFMYTFHVILSYVVLQTQNYRVSCTLHSEDKDKDKIAWLKSLVNCALKVRGENSVLKALMKTEPRSGAYSRFAISSIDCHQIITTIVTIAVSIYDDKHDAIKAITTLRQLSQQMVIFVIAVFNSYSGSCLHLSSKKNPQSEGDSS